MSNKSIIISLVIFLLLSFSYLAYTQIKQASPASQDWWTLYFSNPKDNSLDFVIENNSNETKFHYEAFVGKSVFENQDIEIQKGEKKEIKIASPDIEKPLNSEIKTGITVTAGNDKKEVYKNL